MKQNLEYQTCELILRTTREQFWQYSLLLLIKS